MRYAINVPNFGDYGSPAALVALAFEAEQAGWDGFFIWDHVLGDLSLREPMVDPWVALAAIAALTERIRLGPMITPVARRRPWKLARETVTLDHLSGGRLIFGAGLGHPPDADFDVFGETPHAKVRAQKLDEGLDVLTGLWSGKPFRYDGGYFNLGEVTFMPPPLQQPRIPVWIGGIWPAKRPFRRAAKWDGVFPMKVGRDGVPVTLTPDDVMQVRAYIDRHRTDAAPYDVVIGGETPTDINRATEQIIPYVEAGVTWWMEGLGPWRGSIEKMTERIQAGPPLDVTAPEPEEADYAGQAEILGSGDGAGAGVGAGGAGEDAGGGRT